MTPTKFSAALVFVFALVAGIYGGTRSWKGVIYFSDTGRGPDRRTPAAIKRELDFSRLDGSELLLATQKRLVSEARTILREGSVGIELGHFVTRDENGQRQLACGSMYDTLVLSFEAEGIASAGEVPTMEIEAPCHTNEKDITKIEPIWIPVDELLDTRPADMDIKFGEDVKFKFGNMGSIWPMAWSLRSVRLHRSAEPRRDIKISHDELLKIRSKSLIVNWRSNDRVPSSEDKH